MKKGDAFSFARVRAISFDVGGTLIDPWPSVGHVYADAARESALPALDPAVLNERFASAWSRKAAFDYTEEAWSELVAATFGGESENFRATSPFFCRLYAKFEQADVWRVYEDAKSCLEYFRGSGLRMALISNWDKRLRPLLRNLEIDQFFDHIEVSAESGIHKPSPEIFHHTAAALGLSPGEILHVGDSYKEDVCGARNAGIHAVWLRRNAEEPRAGEVSNLVELVRLFVARGH